MSVVRDLSLETFEHRLVQAGFSRAADAAGEVYEFTYPGGGTGRVGVQPDWLNTIKLHHLAEQRARLERARACRAEC